MRMGVQNLIGPVLMIINGTEVTKEGLTLKQCQM